MPALAFATAATAFRRGDGWAWWALIRIGLTRNHERAREGRDKLRWTRIADYVEDVTNPIRQLPSPSVFIWHSMGGFVIQKRVMRFSRDDLPTTISRRELLIRPEAEKTAHNMSEMWSTFARTGRPAGKGQPEWPVYTTERRATMEIDAQCKVVDDPYGAEREMWWRLEP